MTGAEDSDGTRRWLVEPPEMHEMHFRIVAGDRVEMTPAIRQALDEFIVAVNAVEVEGYAKGCVNYTRGCTDNTFYCQPRLKCTSEAQAPCLIDYQCKIAS
jgi:hypothetical protein